MEKMKINAAKRYGMEILSGAYADDYGKIWWFAMIPNAKEVKKEKVIHPEVCETREYTEMEDLGFYDFKSEYAAVAEAYLHITSNYDEIGDYTKEDILEV
jgi:hypothetical protein